jgi:site-specific recombinase XerC
VFDLQPRYSSSLSILSRTKEPGALDNQRALAAVRRPAHEAADTGLLSPELAAGIGRVKGAKRLGVRIGNWLTVEQSKTLLAKPQGKTLRATRDRAIWRCCLAAVCDGVGLGLEGFQVREEYWVIADLIGKGKHICTVPVPTWAKRFVDEWIDAACISTGALVPTS